jgi:hypothetical protein
LEDLATGSLPPPAPSETLQETTAEFVDHERVEEPPEVIDEGLAVNEVIAGTPAAKALLAKNNAIIINVLEMKNFRNLLIIINLNRNYFTPFIIT